MRSKFAFAGHSCKEFFLTIEYFPGYSAAQKKVETYSVPGRSGQLIFDSGEYENVIQEYEVWLKAPPGHNTHTLSRKIANWLLGASGYQRLEDTYDPDVFRLARFEGPMDVENLMGRYGRVTLEFDCQPQRWLKSGQKSVDVENGQVLYNAWRPARPLIEIKGSGTGMLEIGDREIGISSIPSTGITIDCEIQNAYSGNINRNSLITVPEGFPVLQQGETTVEYSGGIRSVKITPRWWCV